MTALFAAYMGLVTAASLIGASLSQLLTRRQGTTRVAMAFSAGVMLAVCMLYLIPDALAFQHGISVPRAVSHVSIGYALSLGFLSLLSVERYLLRGHHHPHPHAADCDIPLAHHCEHSHTEPDSHTASAAAPDPEALAEQRGVAWSTMIALWLHGMFDGVALYAAGVMPTMGIALVIGIILHKVPESATLLAVLRRGGVSQRQRVSALLLYLLATPLGMLLAAQLLTLLSENGVSLLMAFVAGSLLHLVTGHLLPEVNEAHAAPPHGQGSGLLIMLAGFLTLVVARLLSPG